VLDGPSAADEGNSPRARVQAQDEIESGRPVPDDGDTGHVGRDGQVGDGRILDGAEDHRHAAEEDVSLHERKSQGRFTTRHHQVERHSGVLLLHRPSDEALLTLGKPRDVQVLGIEPDRRRCSALDRRAECLIDADDGGGKTWVRVDQEDGSRLGRGGCTGGQQ
jgi:hypothetical protein